MFINFQHSVEFIRELQIVVQGRNLVDYCKRSKKKEEDGRSKQ